jgi:hypothetical protein
VDLTTLGLEELRSLTEYSVWEALAGSSVDPSRAEIEQEHARRSSLDRYRTLRQEVHAAVLVAVQQIGVSPELRAEPRLGRLPEIVVQQTLETEEPVTQMRLGALYYGHTDFQGSAVAADVRALRDALRTYYTGSGITAPIRIRIPVGRYIAVIRRLTAVRLPPSLAALEHAPRSLAVTALNGLRGMSVFPAVAPGGERIVFSWNHDSGGYAFNLFVQSTGQQTASQLTDAAGAAARSLFLSAPARLG